MGKEMRFFALIVAIRADDGMVTLDCNNCGGRRNTLGETMHRRDVQDDYYPVACCSNGILDSCTGDMCILNVECEPASGCYDETMGRRRRVLSDKIDDFNDLE